MSGDVDGDENRYTPGSKEWHEAVARYFFQEAERCVDGDDRRHTKELAEFHLEISKYQQESEA